MTSGIFSIPSQRCVLDETIYSRFKIMKTPYYYNTHLYSKSTENVGGWSVRNIKQMEGDERIVWLDGDSLHIDLTKLPSNEIDRNKPKNDTGQRPRVANFDLQELVDKFGVARVASIGEFRADGVVFTGKIKFVFNSNYEDSPPLKRGLCLRGATFCDDVEIKNVTFDLSGEGQMEAGYNTSKVDFRDARFFGNVTFRDIRFMGDSPNMELSFEDARICHENKGSDNKIEFNNVDFGNTHLNFFQMILGEFVYGLPEESSSEQGQAGQESDSQGKNIIRFNNVLFGDGAKIDFTDAEIDNGLIEISNISALPLSYFCFAPKVELCYIEKKEEYNSPCNYLSFSNCEIQKSLHIRNVSELSFKNTQNYGKIVAADGWCKIAGCEKLKSAGVFRNLITNKLLQAVYQMRKCEKIAKADLARSFVMLKENFAAMGMYDDEDIAFILYMEYKTYLDKESGSQICCVKKCCYWFLNLVGGYGTAPFRILKSLAVTIGCAFVVFFLCSLVNGYDALSLGEKLDKIHQSMGVTQVLDYVH